MKHCRYCAEEIQDAAIVCRFCNREQSFPRKEADHTVMNAVLALVVVIVVGAGGFMLGQNTLSAAVADGKAKTEMRPDRDTASTTEDKAEQPRLSPPPPPPKPATARVTMMDPRTANLDGGQYMVYSFDLREWQCSVRGYVGVSAGGSRDVDVYFVDDAGLSNYKQGTPFDAYFARSRTTGENLDLSLAPGQYYLIVSNRFSWITGKTVEFGSIAADCTAVQALLPPDGYGDEGDI